jgi:hypothetical protein
LLAGDIEAAQEQDLLQSGQALQSDWLLVPHHGSATSSTQAFLEAVNPSVAIVQAGYRNRFGHPRPDVLRRYSDLGGLWCRRLVVVHQHGAASNPSWCNVSEIKDNDTGNTYSEGWHSICVRNARSSQDAQV